MIILDTNTISELAKPVPAAAVLTWMDDQKEGTLFLTAISLAEIEEGSAILPEGKRKEVLRQNTYRSIEELATPILPFDATAAREFALLVVRAKASRYTLPVPDGYIAAIASVHGCPVATRDTAPFVAAGVAVVNPWEA